jgi:hypothetical protein
VKAGIAGTMMQRRNVGKSLKELISLHEKHMEQAMLLIETMNEMAECCVPENKYYDSKFRKRVIKFLGDRYEE